MCVEVILPNRWTVADTVCWLPKDTAYPALFVIIRSLFSLLTPQLHILGRIPLVSEIMSLIMNLVLVCDLNLANDT